MSEEIAPVRGRNPILRYFTWAHLPDDLADVSRSIGILANKVFLDLPDCAEKSAGLRKLLEAKDCFVRAALELREKKTP